ncbi:MAG: hypothetical protein AAGA60_23015 [Cyanobacteria bacterium P01_E01_bin.42]
MGQIVKGRLSVPHGKTILGISVISYQLSVPPAQARGLEFGGFFQEEAKPYSFGQPAIVAKAIAKTGAVLLKFGV